jgi:hypothetical protein
LFSKNIRKTIVFESVATDAQLATADLSPLHLPPYAIPPTLKKLRGMRRRARQFGPWQLLASASSPLEALAYRQYAIANLAATGWRSFLSRNDYRHPVPPPGIRRAMLAGLLSIYQHWHQVLQQGPESFYLRLWINEREFVRSEVVAAIGARIDWYEGLFETPLPGNPPLPAELRQVPGVQALHWQAYYNEAVFSAEDLNTDSVLKKWVMRRPHRTVEQADDLLYVVRTGRYWIGGLPD